MTGGNPKRRAPNLCSDDEYLRFYSEPSDDGCLEWNGRTNPRGYGEVQRERKGKRTYALAHRLAYETWVGPIPAGKLLRHKCDNPPCINPEHLEPGSYWDNAQDTVRRGRVLRGERHPRSKLTDDEVVEIRKRVLSGEPRKDIASDYGISVSHVGNIHTGYTR